MLRIPPSVRVFVSTTPVDLRLGIDRLAELARREIGEDPFSGDLYCFFGPSRDQVVMLVWDRNGFWVMTKRLERGKYERIRGSGTAVEIERENLVRVLAGIDTKTARFRAGFKRDVRMPSRHDEARSARASG